VHLGEVESLEPGTVKLRGGGKLEADVIIKNLGFLNPDPDDLMGGVCEVVGHQRYRPPIWITPRVLMFRTEHPDVRREQIKRMSEMYTWPASAPFMNEVWLSVYMFFRRHPEKLKELLASDAVPDVRISEGSILDSSIGLHAAVSMDEALRSKVHDLKVGIRRDMHSRYSPKGTPKAMRPMAFMAGFAKENMQYWEESCEKIAGDRHAVPYIGGALMSAFTGGAPKDKKQSQSESQRPVGQAAL